jgi:NADH-quinone oxidoreductase subunit H
MLESLFFLFAIGTSESLIPFSIETLLVLFLEEYLISFIGFQFSFLFSIILSSLTLLVFPFVFVLLAVAWVTGVERNVMGGIQRRKGPNKAGFWGVLQPFSDGIKLFIKFDTPVATHSYLYTLAPLFSMTLAFILFFVIAIPSLPGGDLLYTLHSFGIFVFLTLMGLNILVPIAIISTNNRYSVLGVLRSFTQMFCFEILITWCLISNSCFYESISLKEILLTQTPLLSDMSGMSFLGGFFILLVIFLLLELNRVPFDVAEEESVTVGGIFTEYKGFNFAGFFLAEYLMMLIASSLLHALYLGSHDFVFVSYLFKTVFAFSDLTHYSIKVYIIMLGFILLRSTLPRLRPDHILYLGWVVSIPISIGLFTVSYLVIFG